MTRWDTEGHQISQVRKPEATQISSLVRGKTSIRHGSNPMPDWNSRGMEDGFIPCGRQMQRWVVTMKVCATILDKTCHGLVTKSYS